MRERRVALRCLTAVLLPLLLCALAYFFDVGQTLNRAWMDSVVRGQGARGVAVYIGLVGLCTAIGIPRQICSFLGGYVFGVALGALWATLGTALGCCLTFFYARTLGRRWIQCRFGHKLESCNRFLCQSPFLLTAMVRVVPLGSNMLTNLLAGVSAIPALPFLGGSLLGFFIQNFIFALMGSGIQLSAGSQMGCSIGLYIASLALGFWIYRRYKRLARNAESA